MPCEHCERCAATPCVGRASNASALASSAQEHCCRRRVTWHCTGIPARHWSAGALTAALPMLQEQLRSESLRKDAVTSGAVAVLSVAILLSSGLHARYAALWWCASAPCSGTLFRSCACLRTARPKHDVTVVWVACLSSVTGLGLLWQACWRTG